MMVESNGNSAMPRAIAFAAVLIAISGTSAAAADLPPNTRLGAVFAKPHVAPPPAVYGNTYDYPIFVFAPEVHIPPLVNGYYGKPFSYYYRSYYGSEGAALADAYLRLPYACGFHGYC
jgi:hypothetical protein